MSTIVSFQFLVFLTAQAYRVNSNFTVKGDVRAPPALAGMGGNEALLAAIKARKQPVEGERPPNPFGGGKNPFGAGGDLQAQLAARKKQREAKTNAPVDAKSAARQSSSVTGPAVSMSVGETSAVARADVQLVAPRTAGKGCTVEIERFTGLCYFEDLCNRMREKQTSSGKADYVWTDQAAQTGEVKKKFASKPEAVKGVFRKLKSGNLVTDDQTAHIESLSAGGLGEFIGVYIREAYGDCKDRLSKVFTRMYFMAKKIQEKDGNPDAVEADFDEIEMTGKPDAQFFLENLQRLNEWRQSYPRSVDVVLMLKRGVAPPRAQLQGMFNTERAPVLFAIYSDLMDSYDILFPQEVKDTLDEMDAEDLDKKVLSLVIGNVTVKTAAEAQNIDEEDAGLNLLSEKVFQFQKKNQMRIGDDAAAKRAMIREALDSSSFQSEGARLRSNIAGNIEMKNINVGDTASKWVTKMQKTAFAKRMIGIAMDQQMQFNNFCRLWLSSFIPEFSAAGEGYDTGNGIVKPDDQKSARFAALRDTGVPEAIADRLSVSDVWTALSLLRRDPQNIMDGIPPDISVNLLVSVEIFALVSHFGYRTDMNLMLRDGEKTVRKDWLEALWTAHDALVPMTGVLLDAYLKASAELEMKVIDASKGTEEDCPSLKTFQACQTRSSFCAFQPQTRTCQLREDKMNEKIKERTPFLKSLTGATAIEIEVERVGNLEGCLDELRKYQLNYCDRVLVPPMGSSEPREAIQIKTIDKVTGKLRLVSGLKYAHAAGTEVRLRAPYPGEEAPHPRTGIVIPTLPPQYARAVVAAECKDLIKSDYDVDDQLRSYVPDGGTARDAIATLLKMGPPPEWETYALRMPCVDKVDRDRGKQPARLQDNCVHRSKDLKRPMILAINKDGSEAQHTAWNRIWKKTELILERARAGHVNPEFPEFRPPKPSDRGPGADPRFAHCLPWGNHYPGHMFRFRTTIAAGKTIINCGAESTQACPAVNTLSCRRITPGDGLIATGPRQFGATSPDDFRFLVPINQHGFLVVADADREYCKIAGDVTVDEAASSFDAKTALKPLKRIMVYSSIDHGETVSEVVRQELNTGNEVIVAEAFDATSPIRGTAEWTKPDGQPKSYIHVCRHGGPSGYVEYESGLFEVQKLSDADRQKRSWRMHLECVRSADTDERQSLHQAKIAQARSQANHSGEMPMPRPPPVPKQVSERVDRKAHERAPEQRQTSAGERRVHEPPPQRQASADSHGSPHRHHRDEHVHDRPPVQKTSADERVHTRPPERQTSAGRTTAGRTATNQGGAEQSAAQKVDLRKLMQQWQEGNASIKK